MADILENKNVDQYVADQIATHQEYYDGLDDEMKAIFEKAARYDFKRMQGAMPSKPAGESSFQPLMSREDALALSKRIDDEEAAFEQKRGQAAPQVTAEQKADGTSPVKPSAQSTRLDGIRKFRDQKKIY